MKVLVERQRLDEEEDVDQLILDRNPQWYDYDVHVNDDILILLLKGLDELTFCHVDASIPLFVSDRFP
jgi:hypothetical protein